jgi:hypothetical protein
MGMDIIHTGIMDMGYTMAIITITTAITTTKSRIPATIYTGMNIRDPLVFSL